MLKTNFNNFSICRGWCCNVSQLIACYFERLWSFSINIPLLLVVSEIATVFAHSCAWKFANLLNHVFLHKYPTQNVCRFFVQVLQRDETKIDWLVWFYLCIMDAFPTLKKKLMFLVTVYQSCTEFIPLSIMARCPSRQAVKWPQIMILPTPHFTDGAMFLCWNSAVDHCQTYCSLFKAKSSTLVWKIIPLFF